MRPRVSRQQGSTLVVALIMLILMTMLALTSFKLGKSSLDIVGNMQHHNEALSAAQETLEDVISQTRFIDHPDSVFPNGCDPANPNKVCVDVNGDGVSDVNVLLSPQPTCLRAQPIKTAELNMADPEDAGCAQGVTQNFGIAGAPSGDSLCAESLWEINAVARDDTTEAQATVTQGVAVRVSTDAVATSCP